MLYLIRTTYYDVDTDKVIDLLKIGYTEDSRKETRYANYRLHNPIFTILCEIPNGTVDHESRIQNKFKDLQYPGYGREWFYYSEDIVNFFKNIKSLEEIESTLPRNVGSKSFKEDRKELIRIIKYIYPIDHNELDYDVERIKKRLYDYLHKIINDLGDWIADSNKVFDYLRKDLGDELVDNFLADEDKRKVGNYSDDSKLNEEVCKFIETFNSLPTMYDQLKALCQCTNEKVVKIVVSDYLPKNDDVRIYYNSLGPERLRALSYNKTFIKKELEVIMFDPNKLRSSIYSEFKEGEKYTLSDIKEKLATLYDNLGYKKSSKGTDIVEYFETKSVFITVSKGKQSRGYKLIKKKG